MGTIHYLNREHSTNPTRDWDIAAVWNRRTNIGIHVYPIMNQDYGHSSTIQIFRDRKMGKIHKSKGPRQTNKQPPELGQHTAHSQSEMKVDKTKTIGRTKKGRNSTYMYRRILDLTYF